MGYVLSGSVIAAEVIAVVLIWEATEKALDDRSAANIFGLLGVLFMVLVGLIVALSSVSKARDSVKKAKRK